MIEVIVLTVTLTAPIEQAPSEAEIEAMFNVQEVTTEDFGWFGQGQGFELYVSFEEVSR